MFESAKLKHDIDKAEFEELVPDLRTKLLEVQFDLADSKKFPVILVFAGMEGTGVVDALTGASAVLDTRLLNTYAFDEETRE
jgi:polyphosphate kinase 2 (PPK2 family)